MERQKIPLIEITFIMINDTLVIENTVNLVLVRTVKNNYFSLCTN